MKLERIVKVGLATLLFLCLADMSYGFYQLVRLIALVVFVILAYKSHERGETNMSLVYGILALLFQPIFKLSLGREIWNIVDVIVGVGLLLTVFGSNQTLSRDNKNKDAKVKS